MANNELTAEVIRQIVREEVGALRSEMNQRFEELERNTVDGFERVIATIDAHMLDTDKKFSSDRRRIDRLEKAVIL